MFILQDMDYYFSHFPVLETERLILRAKTAADAEDMKTYMADENLYKYWGRNMTRQEREPSLFFGRTLLSYSNSTGIAFSASCVKKLFWHQGNDGK